MQEGEVDHVTIITLLVVPALYALWFRVRKDEPAPVEHPVAEGVVPMAVAAE